MKKSELYISLNKGYLKTLLVCVSFNSYLHLNSHEIFLKGYIKVTELDRWGGRVNGILTFYYTPCASFVYYSVNNHYTFMYQKFGLISLISIMSILTL